MNRWLASLMSITEEKKVCLALMPYLEPSRDIMIAKNRKDRYFKLCLQQKMTVFSNDREGSIIPHQ